MDSNPTLTLLEQAEQTFGELSLAEKKLFTLAQETFQELSDSEYKLFRAIANSEVFTCQTGIKAVDKPANAAKWGARRILRSDRLRWLCVEPEVWKLCLPIGIAISGAKIEGSLNLNFAEIGIPLRFFQCYFAETLYLQQAKLRQLELSGTWVGSIDAQHINIAGSIFLDRGFEAQGMVKLSNANIGGDLSSIGGKFTSENGIALFADSIQVTGSIFLCDGFEAKGQVLLMGTNIGRNLICSGGRFINENSQALMAHNIKVVGSVVLDYGFEAKGAVTLVGASIEGNFSCRGGKFSNGNETALGAPSLKVTGDVDLRDGFEAKGLVSLFGARIEGNLNCTKGMFINRNGSALFAESIQVIGHIILNNGFEAKGIVNLASATIEGSLYCYRGKFINEHGDALLALGINVTGHVLLSRGFEAKGGVSLAGTKIEGDLHCSGGKFTNENGNALFAPNIQVSGNVLLTENFEAKGKVILRNARIETALHISRVKEPEGMLLDLQFARIQTLDHHDDSFPSPGNLHLNGLVYEALGGDLLNHSDRHLRWLRLQPTDPFSSQPYEQLAKVLQSAGKRDEAVQVLIAREEDELKYGKQSWFGKTWEQFLGITIAYGYKPERAIYWAIGVVIAGSVLFHFGYQNGLITPTEKDCKPADKQLINDCSNYPSYPKFNPLIYSLDVFLPIIDLRLKGAWLPNANQGNPDTIVHFKSGAWLRYYFWFQVIAGWVLTTLWVAGFTGLVRNTNK